MRSLRQRGFVCVRRYRLLTAPLLLTATASCLSGCSQPLSSEPAREFRFLSGIALDMSQALITRYNESVPKARVSMDIKTGSLVVVSALHRGEGDLGFAQADVVYLAYRRGLEGERHPHTSLRGMAVLWVNNLYIAVPRGGPIRRIQDLKGARVGVLRPGTSGEVVTRIVLDAYGMSYSDIKPEFDRGDLILARLRQGELDAAITSYPVPLDLLSGLDASMGLRLIPVDTEVINRLKAGYPFLRRVVIPSGQLPNLHEDVETVGTEYLLICRLDLEEQLVYQLTKEFFAALPHLATQHAEARLIDPGLAPGTPIPLHPGAARYYREREILQ